MRPPDDSQGTAGPPALAAAPLTPLELASGTLPGEEPGASGLPEVPPDLTPRAALEAEIRRALERPPCLVSFSGGRDSSGILALGAHVARRDGLPLPVPVSVRFPEAPGMDEAAWQELVVARAGLEDWERLDVGEELDLVGRLARALVARHGLLFPPSVSLIALLLERVRGGSLLTGVGGDAHLGGWRLGRLSDALAGRERPTPYHLAAIGYALAPRSLRARALRRHARGLPWLQPAARDELTAATVAYEATEPARFDAQVAWRARQRRNLVMERSLAALGQAAGAHVSSPLAAPRFLAALARAGGARGFGGRTALMRRLFGDVLPERVAARGDKASPAGVFFTTPSRRVAEAWDGSGVDAGLVDPPALRDAWLARSPDPRTWLLLQSVVVQSRPRSAPREDA